MDVLKIFVVEDDPFYGQILKHHLSLNPDYDVHLFESGSALMKNLYLQPDIVSIDFGLPDITGDKLLKQILLHNASLPVIVISGQEEISIAVNLLKLGARDYIIKDDNTKENLWKSILHIRENLHLKREVETLKEELGKKYSFENTIIGTSEAIKSTFKLLQKAIDTTINVSITGETGTGKEVYAKAIHYNGLRKKKPFIAVNMGAIPSDLAESELFGHEKGAFTGATGLKKGKFEEAHGGTLFLDEIGELDLNLQTKLLRVIQEREIVRVGGSQPIKVDIRLITATHKNMAEEVKKGNFREDLFFRIVGLPIDLPPLRKRDNDVILLAKFFVEEFAKNNKSKVLKISNQAQTKLRKYPWPGNVRELKAIIDLACVMTDGNEIKPDDISFYELGDTKVYSEVEKTLKEYESEIISHFLNKYDQNVLLVAEKLDIGKSKIYNLLKSGVLTTKS
jgi:DNA-binding NtrC family response regulator